MAAKLPPVHSGRPLSVDEVAVLGSYAYGYAVALRAALALAVDVAAGVKPDNPDHAAWAALLAEWQAALQSWPT